MKNLLFLTLITISSINVNAQNACRELFKSTNPILAALDEKPVAIGEVDVYGKKIPTILVNNESVDSLKEIYNQSIGIAVIHQKGYNNDHGMLRLGDYFIDRDRPGARQRGETHQTGISWAEVKGYTKVAFNRAGSYNRVEVLFQLSKPEFEVAMTYQKMRKAGIIRPDFNFGGDFNPKGLNNRLTECGEICFSFSTGSATSSQMQSIQRKFQELRLRQSYEQIVNDPEMQTYLKEAKDKIFKSDLAEDKLSPEMLSTLKIPDIIDNQRLEKIEETELLNWIVGFEITKDYNSLLNTLQISNSSDYSNARNQRASAVLIYDGNTKKEQFLRDDYQSQGVFSTWTNTKLTVHQDGVTNLPPQKEVGLLDGALDFVTGILGGGRRLFAQ